METPNQYQKRCEQQNLMNTMKELQRENVNKRINCGQINPEMGPKKRTPCCTLSPVTPTPLIKTNVCERQRLPSRNLCTTVQNECDRPELTAYGKEFMANNGKLVTKCVCVKFNGLQDSCRHPGCYTKDGCLDNPFPTCPPAEQWKLDYAPKSKKNNGCCN
ncbi:uncharacterized protein LOC100575735 [Acyrthosiphon pisum]|uniref:Uncharacterized protein n=1 Tax=Acyrthosiphon pisum TaxID=7029 RepID=A0A8R2A5Y2_ACYPI|nr:uncharacterized protein LOC100575735 [Acyrthosiphon pisum]|eukprot:XP_003245545.1 PREDICTED: uncharacterized protein LOC100575735 [Acyrthosiphon pisum]